jgi:hemerythrin-like domain-containing protein
MPVQIGAPREHGFDEPLGLLSDCHRRIEKFLGILVRVAQECRGKTLSEEHRRAVEAALEYFHTAAPRHTADEEDSLFPILRACDEAALGDALRTLAELEADHVKADRLHAATDRLFRKWLDSGRLPEAEEAELADALGELSAIYRDHIAVEDHRVFPLAGKLLDAAQLARIGAEMAQRRGLPAPKSAGG